MIMMKKERFLNREEQPTEEMIQKRIGNEVFPVWEDVRDYLAEAFPDFQPEMVFYNDQEGWSIRYRKDLQHLCTLFPERGAFAALIPLDPQEDQQALEKIHYFNARLRELLSRQSALPQGRWLWLRLEDHTDFVGFKLLLAIKKP
jgi:hypothetical protein